ncbi:hypothetical protein TRIP_B330230 [uncultured Desulfatiglans sp.]|uniref:Uncharacterized protein n=1 Tax=Uncultured Desulfatiglans sp. TaxID=1748965 RepID=A0A653A8T1_UNCDX|nr:hypothetical protein TRIP_B330230 [uncultured Desulfatiglans sp.]
MGPRLAVQLFSRRGFQLNIHDNGGGHAHTQKTYESGMLPRLLRLRVSLTALNLHGIFTVRMLCVCISR